jgi:hypothetical protein
MITPPAGSDSPDPWIQHLSQRRFLSQRLGWPVLLKVREVDDDDDDDDGSIESPVR